jgi:hypothetical protein
MKPGPMDVEMPDRTNKPADGDKKKQILSGISSKDDKQPSSLESKEDIDSLTIEGILLSFIINIIFLF